MGGHVIDEILFSPKSTYLEDTPGKIQLQLKATGVQWGTFLGFRLRAVSYIHIYDELRDGNQASVINCNVVTTDTLHDGDFHLDSVTKIISSWIRIQTPRLHNG